MDFSYYNGTYGTYDRTTVSLSDRAIFFGDGVYDCMVGKNGKIYQLDEHLNRLFKNTKIINLDFNFSKNGIAKIINELIKLSGYKCYTVYIQVSRSGKRRKHFLPEYNTPNLLITITERVDPTASSLITLMSTEDIRYSMCHVKTLNLLPSVLAASQAELRGYDEAVFLRDGIVTECSHSNISIIKSSVLYTHPLNNFILPGITRANLIKKAKSLGIDVIESTFGYQELIDADEVIVTSTTAFARRVKKIDENAVFCRAQELANALCSSLVSDYDESCC